MNNNIVSKSDLIALFNELEQDLNQLEERMIRSVIKIRETKIKHAKERMAMIEMNFRKIESVIVRKDISLYQKKNLANQRAVV